MYLCKPQMNIHVYMYIHVLTYKTLVCPYQALLLLINEFNCSQEYKYNVM